jgi:hypothetical protein
MELYPNPQTEQKGQIIKRESKEWQKIEVKLNKGKL